MTGTLIEELHAHIAQVRAEQQAGKLGRPEANESIRAKAEEIVQRYADREKAEQRPPSRYPSCPRCKGPINPVDVSYGACQPCRMQRYSESVR